MAIPKTVTVRQHWEWVTVEPLGWDDMLAIVRVERPDYDPDSDLTLKAFPSILKRDEQGHPPSYEEMIEDMKKNGGVAQVHGTAKEWFPRLAKMGLKPTHHDHTQAENEA